MSKIRDFLRKLIGRVDKVKLVRDLLLLVFGAFFVYLSPAVSDLTNVSNWPDFNRIFQANPILPWIILIPFVALILMLVFIHKIDNWVDSKQDDKLDKMVKLLEAMAEKQGVDTKFLKKNKTS
jgi:hypothetical protein